MDLRTADLARALRVLERLDGRESASLRDSEVIELVQAGSLVNCLGEMQRAVGARCADGRRGARGVAVLRESVPGAKREQTLRDAPLARGITSYTRGVKTAISIPDDDLARLDRVAAQHGMNRSEFFRRAGRRLADELEGGSQLTGLADAAIAAAGQPTEGGPFLAESQRIHAPGDEW